MAFHTVLNGQPASGPFTRIVSTQTVLTKWWNGTEQRGIGRGVLVNFIIPFVSIPNADKENLRTDVAAAGGKFDGTLSFAFNGVTYTNLTLLDDSFLATEKNNDMLFNVELHLRQTIPQALTATTPTAFPALAAGPKVELPFSQQDRYQTSTNESPSGMHYAYQWFGGGLTGFPTRGLKSWPLSFPWLTDADLATIEQMFIGMNGKTGSFSFTDPITNVTYSKCRFGQDDLSISHQRYNFSSIDSLLIEETN